MSTTFAFQKQTLKIELIQRKAIKHISHILHQGTYLKKGFYFEGRIRGGMEAENKIKTLF